MADGILARDRLYPGEIITYIDENEQIVLALHLDSRDGTHYVAPIGPIVEIPRTSLIGRLSDRVKWKRRSIRHPRFKLLRKIIRFLESG